MTTCNDVHWESDLSGINLTLPPLPPDILKIHYTNEAPSVGRLQNACPFSSAATELFNTTVSSARYLTSEHDVKKMIELWIDVEKTDFEFLPGDTIGIVPENYDSEIECIASLLNINDVLHKRCTLHISTTDTKKNTLIPKHLPPVSTLYNILKTCVDIRAVPKKIFLRVMAEYTTDSSEKRCLEELSSRQGALKYTKCILEGGRNVLDILNKFQTCKPPIEKILELLPRLQPRSYSISSSQLVSPKLRIIVSVVDKPRNGVCSGWLDCILTSSQILSGIVEDDYSSEVNTKEIKQLPARIPMFFRKRSSFVLPDDLTIPLILIGSGTGIAPFLGFLEHRDKQKSMHPCDDFGDIWIFYGCRYPERDFFCRSELEEYSKNGILSRLFVSFSRENNSSVKYVQDNIRLHHDIFIHQFLEKGSIIFVCGDAKNMVKDVYNTVVNIIQEEKGISENEACSFLKELQKNGRYMQDAWL